MNREDCAKTETSHIPQIISLSGIYVIGRCLEKTILANSRLWSIRNISKLSSAHIFYIPVIDWPFGIAT